MCIDRAIVDNEDAFANYSKIVRLIVDTSIEHIVYKKSDKCHKKYVQGSNFFLWPYGDGFNCLPSSHNVKLKDGKKNNI